MPEQVTRFGGLAVAYDEDVLAPRPWTLEQSCWAVDLLSAMPAGPVLELCAGAGQIGLVVAVETGRPLVQVDADERACSFARRNAGAAGVVSDVRCGDMDSVLAADERFGLVLADPPYIPSDKTDGHPDDPSHTIDGGDDGLELARQCLRVAARHLDEGGLVLVQLRGPKQVAALSTESAGYGLTPVGSRDCASDGSLLLLRRDS